jgi:uroporphyrinogen decarboxylase/ferrochelatase
MTEHTLSNSLFLRACRGEPTERPPVWFMRQAGRYMPEYRAIRANQSMLETIFTPQLAAEITLQPINAFGFDAAIIFADILPPLMGMGLDLEFVKGVGPRLENALSSPADIDRLATPPATATKLANTLEAIKLVTAELTPRGVPLIGFAGAPFTLANYAIEGGGSRNYLKAKSLMAAEPSAWKRLMTKLVTVQADYLVQQAKAGASALQIFDSWAGLALDRDDYNRFVLPYNRKLVELVKAGTGSDIPVIYFSTGTGAYLADIAAVNSDVVGVDWRLPLDEAWAQIGFERPIQGNLDPAALLYPWEQLRARVDAVLQAAAGRPGHVFNLGHGIFPSVPVENVKRVVDYIKSMPVRSEHFSAQRDSSRTTNKTGVLVMAYGGPNSLDDLPGYLADIRSGRPTTPAVLEEISNNYRLIGGKSPLLGISEAQVAAVAEKFEGQDVTFYLGMRHWSPWIEDVVGQMIDDGIEEAVSIVLAPHYSKLSVAKYQQKVRDGLDMHHGEIRFRHIESYHDHPLLIRALAERVDDGLSRWPEAERDHVHVVFSAHSLPERILKMGDPYDSQLRETAALVAAEAGLADDRWSWSYQSAGRSPEPWLGPQLPEHLADLAGQGVLNVISIPVGFVCDHVEILYDIDIQGQQVARELGMRLERPPALNTDPLFIEALVDVLSESIKQETENGTQSESQSVP